MVVHFLKGMMDSFRSIITELPPLEEAQRAGAMGERWSLRASIWKSRDSTLYVKRMPVEL